MRSNRGFDHYGLLFAVFGGQTCHHLGKDTYVAAPLPMAMDRLVKAIGERDVAPIQAIATYKNNPTSHTPIIDAWLTLRRGKTEIETRHLRVVQPKQIKYAHYSFFEP